MIITGDLQQTDLLKENGLYDFVNRIKKVNDTSSLIKLINLDNSDIERSEIVKKVIEIYDSIPNQDTKIPQEKINQKNDTIVQKVSPSSEKKNNDAALIPIHHISQHHDIFSYKLEF